MDILLLIIGLWIYERLAAPKRLKHWRGPREASDQRAQNEHLRQFHDPAPDTEDDDE